MTKSDRSGACLSSRTFMRFMIVRYFPRKRMISWIPYNYFWRLYGFLEWSALRAQDVAMELEDIQGENGKQR